MTQSHKWIARVCLFLTSLMLASPLFATTQVMVTQIEGYAFEYGGDRLCIRPFQVRLWGIDAFNEGQKCCGVNGEAYDCGAQSQAALMKLLPTMGSNVTCTVWGVDAQNRPLASCRTGTTDINEAMVRAGWVLATKAKPSWGADYSSAQRDAETSRRGVWSFGRSSFETPSEWRSTHGTIDSPGPWFR